MSNGKKTFVKITNWQIWNDIQEIKAHQQEHFELVEKRLDVINGKVKLSRWIATTALSLSVIGLGFIVQQLMKR